MKKNYVSMSAFLACGSNGSTFLSCLSFPCAEGARPLYVQFKFKIISGLNIPSINLRKNDVADFLDKSASSKIVFLQYILFFNNTT